MSFENTLRSRWNPAWTDRADTAPLHSIMDGALRFATVPAAKRAELKGTGELSEKGLGRSLRTTLAANVLGELRKYEAALKADQEAAAAARANLGKPQVDKADVFAELQRQEVRAYLRGLPDTQRLSALVTNPDATILAAALSAAPALSGLTPEHFAIVQKAHVETNFAPQLAALEERDEAHAMAKAALDWARMEAQREVGLPDHQFQSWWSTGQEPAEAQAA